MTDLNWRKSSRSQQNGQCVELALQGRAVRDSKNPEGAVLTFDESAARSFLTAVKRDAFAA